MEANNKQVHVDSIEEEIVARVAGIDVAKDSGMVCTRVPHQSQPGKRTTTVWSVSARTNSIIELADRLAEERIERVVLEATSDYWRPFYYLLASAGPGGRAREGLAFVVRHPVLRASLGCATTVNFFTFVSGSVIVLFASRGLGLSAGVIGLAFGVGSTGALLAQ